MTKITLPTLRLKHGLLAQISAFIRLGLFDPQAQRILQALRKQGIIEEVQRGQRYDPKNPPPKGTRLKASVFRWLPD